MTISIEQCIDIIKKKEVADAQKGPIVVGTYQNVEVSAAVGRYGPYVAFNKQFYPLPAGTDIKKVTIEQAVEAIQKKEEKNTIKSFEENKEVRIMKGKYGHYIAYKGKNYKIDKNLDIKALSLQQCLSLIDTADNQESKKTTKTKTATAKKTRTSTKTKRK